MSGVVLLIATMVFGIIVIASVFAFGLRVYHDRFDDRCRELVEHFVTAMYPGAALRTPNDDNVIDLKPFWEMWDDILRRRNKFWELFGQVALSIAVSVILAVLLLTKSITAKAGLPILSAIVAFVIGKGIEGQSRAPTGTPAGPPDARA